MNYTLDNKQETGKSKYKSAAVLMQFQHLMIASVGRNM
jgi:hypothetical protein